MDIEITLSNYRCFAEDNPATFVVSDGLTALVGENNSGKSALLRFQFEFRDLFRELASTSGLRQVLEPSGRSFNLAPPGAVEAREMFCKYNNGDMVLSFRLNMNDRAELSSGDGLANRLVVTIPRNTNRARGTIFVDDEPIPSGPLNSAGTRIALGDLWLETEHIQSAFSDLSKARYLPAFRNAINIGANSEYFDIRTGQAFITAWDNYKAGVPGGYREGAALVEERIAAVFGFNRFEMNASADNQDIVLMIDGKSHRLNEVGSGVSQFVLSLVNAVLGRPTFLLVDEPELNLHPTLQLQYLELLQEFAMRGVIFTTHNVGLAQAAGGGMYSVIRGESGGSQVHPYEQTPRLAQMLGELSYSAFKDLGHDRVLLVEGPTDVAPIRHLLAHDGKEYVVLLTLGGGSMINGNREDELREVTRMSPNVFRAHRQ